MKVSVWRNSDINALPLASSNETLIKGETYGATPHHKCLTCNQGVKNCHGHWYRMNLPFPVVRPAFDLIINNILPRLCLHCGIKVKISPADLNVLITSYTLHNYQSEKYVSVVTRLRKENTSATKCKVCDSAPHGIKYINNIFSSNNKIIRHNVIYNLFRSIPFTHYPILGLVKTDLTNLFFESYPIAPLYLRSPNNYKNMILDSGITRGYLELITAISTMNVQEIQKAVTNLELSDSDIPKSSFGQSFIGKYTLFRSLINSYSGDNTMRNVLNANESSHPEVGYFCREYYTTMTSKLYFNKYTMNIINNLQKLNKIKYIKSGDRYLLPITTITLLPGDCIEALVGDLMYFGYHPRMISYRQPSLHKYSIVAQVAHYRNTSYHNSVSSTFSTTALPGINGDQDGDEFNSRLVSDIKSHYEHRYVMSPRVNMITDSTGSLAYGLIQVEVPMFIRLLMREGSKWYSDLLPENLKNAVFETDTNDEIMVGRKTSNLIKNIYQLSSPASGYKFFYNLVMRIKSALTSEGMCFMIKELYEARDIILSLVQERDKDITLMQSELNAISKMMPPSIEYVSKKLDEMIKKYNKRITDWYNTLDPKTNNYAIAIKAGNLKITTRMLAESLVMQNSETIIDPSQLYIGRRLGVYKRETCDVGGYGVITGSLFNGLDFKSLIHTAAAARKKVIITSIGTAVPGMISRNLMKSMEDMYINYSRYVVQYNRIIDHCYNYYKLNASDLFILKTSFGERLFPIDVPFILKNIDTLVPSGKQQLMQLSEQQTQIKLFASEILEEYHYSLGAVDLYIVEVLNDLLPQLTVNQLQYIFNTIRKKYKTGLPFGTPVGAHVATTIGEMITQSVISNFHSVKKGGEVIELAVEARNMDLIRFSASKKFHIVKIQGDVDSLQFIQRVTQYVSLDMLGYRLVNVQEQKSDYLITFSLVNNLISSFMLNESDVLDIVANELNNLQYINKAEVSYQSYNMITEISIKVRFESLVTKDVSMISLLVMYIRYFSKGNIECSVNVEKKTLSMNLSSLSVLGYFNTTQLSVSLSPQMADKQIGIIQSYQGLINEYYGSNMQKLAFRTLALFQVRYSKPLGIRKYPTIGQPVISKLSHQKTYYDLQKAAVLEESQLDSIPSSILLGTPVKIGTGYYEVSQDISIYMNSIVNEKLENVDNLIL